MKEYSENYWSRKVIKVEVVMKNGCKTIIFACLVLLTVAGMVLLFVNSHSNINYFNLITAIPEANNNRVSGVPPQNHTSSIAEANEVLGAPQNHTTRITTNSQNQYDSSQHETQNQSKFMEGLFGHEFDKQSCLSKHQSSLFRKPSPHKPSPYLLSKLRNYETLHRRCGPYSKPYNKSLKLLKSGSRGVAMRAKKCDYVVYTSMSGLGNRMLTVASAFLYALLTNRVLLVEFGTDTSSLFCEPFPDTTWLLPMDYPLREHFGEIFNQEYPRTYGNLMKKKAVLSESMGSPPAFLYVYLAYNADRHDGLFYCDENQAQLKQIPWLVLTSNQYFVPSLFLVPCFKRELGKLFPDKETVFHHLGRYLFQPSNEAWGLITRFYQAYLAKADQRIGIQIRVFDTKTTLFQNHMDQILSCTLKEKILPKIEFKRFVTSQSKNQTTKAVLITSLHSNYYERIREMYWTKPTATGEVVGVYQPSHEESEQYGNDKHSMKAWTEMNLLSMCDVLVTSSMSTFGYVAQALGGLRPWILPMPVNGTGPYPPCRWDVSMEPCFHFPPRLSESCKRKANNVDGGRGSHVRHCVDVGWGLKLVDDH